MNMVALSEMGNSPASRGHQTGTTLNNNRRTPVEKSGRRAAKRGADVRWWLEANVWRYEFGYFGYRHIVFGDIDWHLDRLPLEWRI